MTRCGYLGYVVVGGREVGRVRCDLDEGHDVERSLDVYGRDFGDWIEPTPHAVTLTWQIERDDVVDLDLFDPDERFDVEIPFEPVISCECVRDPATGDVNKRGCRRHHAGVFEP